MHVMYYKYNYLKHSKVRRKASRSDHRFDDTGMIQSCCWSGVCNHDLIIYYDQPPADQQISRSAVIPVSISCLPSAALTTSSRMFWKCIKGVNAAEKVLQLKTTLNPQFYFPNSFSSTLHINQDVCLCHLFLCSLSPSSCRRRCFFCSR